MLDQSIQLQLRDVFSALTGVVTLSYDESRHSNQRELVNMLTEISDSAANIILESSGHMSLVPSFRILREGSPTGVSFRGIPGGHEFTSLILAILHADGKGKMPDQGIQSRIKNLQGPVRIQSFISLTCENCPDVVQALNLMALIHADFQHEVIDGAYAQEDVTRLGIQGVPSLIVDSKMIHSGRIDFLDLLTKLESTFGNHASSKDSGARDLGRFDVVVLGGGPAGVSAAIYSARKGLKTVLVAEKMGGQVKDTKGIENLVSVVYTEGPQLADQLYKHLTSYPVTIFDQRRVANLSKERVVTFDSGETIGGASIIIATGAKWRELGVSGEKEYLGRGVAYCPHCDGPFYKGKKIAVLGGGNSGIEAAIDLAGIAGAVTVYEFADSLKADQVLIDKLMSLKNTKVLTNVQTTSLIGDGKKIVGLEFVNRADLSPQRSDIDGVFVQIGLLPNSGFAAGTIDLTKFGEIVVDEKGRTSLPGIYAAGDVTTTPYKQIIIAMGEGAKVALAAFEDRLHANFKF